LQIWRRKTSLQEDSEPAVRETRSSTGQSVVETAAQFAASAEVSQTVLPVLMSSASVHEEPASLEFKSAESANDTKQTTAETTKKTQRSAIRRPPLHRRFQLERPVSESSAGSETVTRKLRLDQTGGNAEISAGEGAGDFSAIVRGSGDEDRFQFTDARKTIPHR
jgi:hypothetical protein